MVSISLIVFGLAALAFGLFHFRKKVGNVLGSIVILVIGLVSLYIAITLSDLILGAFGFQTWFPPPATGYYLYQAFIYILLGVAGLISYYFLLKDSASREVSEGLWWAGGVLLISGASDLFIDVFIRVQRTELRLLLSIVALVVLLWVGSHYRSKLFGSNEGLSTHREAPKKKGII